MKALKVIIATLAVVALAVFASSCKKENGKDSPVVGQVTYTMTEFIVEGNLKTVEAALRSDMENLAKASTGVEGKKVQASMQAVVDGYAKQVGTPYKYKITFSSFNGSKEQGFVSISFQIN